MAKGMSMKVLLQLQTKEFQKGINNIKKQLNGFKNFIKSAFALGSVTLFGKQMVQVGKEFENAMSRVQAVSNATQEEFRKMQAEAEKLGKTTRYTATEAANALENLTRNGMNAANATKALSSVLQLAQANSIGLADAANIITNTLNMFNLGVSQASRVNDVLSSTASHAATDINLLYEAMVNAAPAANVLGFSIEEVSSAIGALAQRGVKGAEAGTKLRIAFQKMADPKVIAKMKEQGINIDENTMKTEGLLKTVEKIAKADLSLGQLGKIFDAKSAMAVQMLASSLGDLEYMLDVTANSAGETERMFNQSVGSVQKELDSLKSMYEGLMISISQKTSGVVKSVIKLLQNLITNFETLGGTIMNIASVAVPLLASRVIQLGTAIRGAMQGAAASIATLKAAMGGIISLIATLVTWVGTALVGAWNRANKEMRDAKKQMSEATIEAKRLQDAVTKIKDQIGDGSNKGTLTSAIKEATRLFPEFASAINNAKRIAERTGEWEKLKQVLQDIADLQALVTTRDAKKALAEAQAGKLGRQMWNDSMGSFGMWGAPDKYTGNRPSLSDDSRAIPSYIRKALREQGLTKDAQQEVFNEMGKLVLAAESFNEGVDDAIKLLKDYNVTDYIDEKYIRGYLNTYNTPDTTGIFNPNHVNRNYKIDKYNNARAAQSDVDSLNKLIVGKTYNQLKKGFDDVDTLTRQELGDISKHQQEYNERMYEAAQDFFDKVTDLNLPADSDELKEALAIVAKYPKPSTSNTSGGGGGSSSSSSSSKIEKTDADYISDAIKDYNEAKTKLDNRLEAGTITTKDYERELDNLEDRVWEVITAFSDFRKLLGQLKQEAFGAAMEAAYKENRTKEGAAERYKQYTGLESYVVPKEPVRNTKRDYIKTEKDKLEETVKIKFDYAEALSGLAQDFQKAIDAGDFNLVKGDAIGMLENLKDAASKASDEADTLQSKLDLSEMITKLDDEIKSLNVTTLTTFTTLADAMDRVTSSLMNIAQVFNEDLKDSPFFQAYQAFNSVLSSSIQIMEAVMQVIQLKSALEKKSAMTKVKSAAMEVAANQVATQSEIERATAEAGAAVAGGASAVASIPYVGPVLAVAAAAAITAAILAGMKKFATGGIVGGNNYTGDKNVVRVNSGEMILNKAQQRNLLDIANGKSGTGGQVEFKIRGADLVGAIKNYNRLVNP